MVADPSGFNEGVHNVQVNSTCSVGVPVIEMNVKLLKDVTTLESIQCRATKYISTK